MQQWEYAIQTRGGCSCAGPYGHRLLAIDTARSHALRDEITERHCEGVRPGWTRLNFHYFLSDTVRFLSDTVRGYLIDAVDLLAADGHRLLPDYRFDPATGLWRHRRFPADPPLRLADVGYDADGRLTWHRGGRRLGEDALESHLADARALLLTRCATLDDGPTGLPDDFEALRWFPLPPACLDRTPLPDAGP